MSNLFLQGKYTAIRPFQADDLDFVYRWFNDQEATRYMFTGQKPQTREQIAAQLTNDTQSPVATVFVALEKETGTPIGLVGLYEIHSTARKAEMRIILGAENIRGKGYGTELVRMITFYGFDRLNLHRIYLGFTSENEAARRAYEKAGYKYEGELKEDIYRNSRYYDSIRMAMLRDEYYEKLYPEDKLLFS